MNRKEFLDILRDYLIKQFSEDETNDIIRDYEEYFIDGEMEGKSDLDTISALGSPKSIARDLINQIENDEIKDTKKDKLEEVFLRCKKSLKEKYYMGKEFLEKKLTPRLNNNSLPNEVVRIILILISALLIVPTFLAICFMACIAGVLSLSLITFLISVPLMVSFSWPEPQIALFFIFLSIAFIGIQILSWQIFVFAVKYMKRIYKKYANWIKTKKLYINAIKEKSNGKKDKGGKNNE